MLTDASAQDNKLGSGLKRFAADSYSETIEAVQEIAGSGAPHAAALLKALAARRVMRDPNGAAVYYASEDGSYFDALTGRKTDEPAADLETVRINNRVRSAIQAALGSLGILSADVGTRRSAAAALIKSRDVAALAALESAIAKEKDSTALGLMQTARAAIVLATPDAPDTDKLAAIRTLGTRTSQQALSILRSVPATAQPQVRQAARTAAADIEGRLRVWAVAQNLWYGLSLGSVLLLAAIGLAITFGVMGVINMAHGEMVMLGAYTTFVVQEVFRSFAPDLFDLSIIIAIPAAFLVAGAAGVAIERGVIRFLYGRPLETLLATWGVSLILQQAVRTAFGPTNREVGTPSFMSGAFELGGLVITWNRLYIMLFAATIFVGLLLALKRTSLGLHMRAVTQNRRMASSMGIRTARIDALTFGLGSGIAGLAGVALSQIDNVSPNLGQTYIIDSFLVVVFGGVGNLWGTLIGAATLGIANKLLEPFAGAVLAKIGLLVIIILFIQRRPRGLFALKGRAVEA
ncbi:MAG: urea ABC transporter permease subunit UrtB [Hyphomicrobiaceae bacterium]